MEKNKKLKALSRKKDFELLKKRGRQSSHLWMRACFLAGRREEGLRAAWKLPKKYVFPAPARSRLKRWGRESLKSSRLNGFLLLIFRRKAPGFYKKLKRKDFDDVLSALLEKVSKAA